MSHDEEKRLAGRAALAYVEDGTVIGIGTGSTVACFIDALVDLRHRIDGVVSSSERSTALLRERGIAVLDLNSVGPIPLYVDGADECDPRQRLIKGGGGALTREKIVAAAAQKFVCLIDSSKRVEVLGAFPLPIEVIPMARSLVAREIAQRGGRPVWRENFTTDNDNLILDVHGWHIADPVALERELNQLAGVVSVGLFAQRPADIVLVGDREMPRD